MVQLFNGKTLRMDIEDRIIGASKALPWWAVETWPISPP